MNWRVNRTALSLLSKNNPFKPTPMRLLATLTLILLTVIAQAQKVSGKLVFQPGQVLSVNTKSTSINLINAMGQEIELKSEAIADHQFKVTNTTEESHTLSHEINRIRLTSEGMGNSIDFDSQKEKDLNGQFGAPIKELMGNKYSLVIDGSGNTLIAMNQGNATSSDPGMLAQLLGSINEFTGSPKQGEASFFKVLPSTEVGTGDGWTNTIDRNGSKVEEAYSIAEINDNFILINYLANSATTSKGENMGMEFTINVKNKTEGKIMVDRTSGIVKEKNLKTTSTGTASTSFGEIPVNTTTTSVVTIN
jgi:hypothetical protein